MEIGFSSTEKYVIDCVESKACFPTDSLTLAMIRVRLTRVRVKSLSEQIYLAMPRFEPSPSILDGKLLTHSSLPKRGL